MQVFYFDATLSKCKIYFLGAAILKFCLVFFRQTFQDIPVALLHILTIGYIKHMVFVYLVLRLHIVL